MSENQNGPVRLTVKGILRDLSNGQTRSQIQAKYGLSAKDMKELFQHPDLKGKKTTPAPGFILVDDDDEPADISVNDTEEEEEMEDEYKESSSLV